MVLTVRSKALNTKTLNLCFALPSTGDKSLPPKLEPPDAIPSLHHTDADSEPPTLKPIDDATDRIEQTHSKRLKLDADGAELLSSAPRLNGHSLQNALLDDGVSLLATPALAEPTGVANNRTAVVFHKSKAGGASESEDKEFDGADGSSGEQEGENADASQLGSKSFLSVVIPRLETLLHSKKRKHGDGRGKETEEGEAEHKEEEAPPGKRLNTGKTCRETIISVC